eukprot:jgi/Bigna1/129466/aug1.9_g4174
MEKRFNKFKELRICSRKHRREKFDSLMRQLRRLPDLDSREFAILIRSNAEMGRNKDAMDMFNKAVKKDVISTELYNTAMSAQRNTKNWRKALSIFKSIPEKHLSRDVVSYNTIITVLTRSGQWASALRLAYHLIDHTKDMKRRGGAGTTDETAGMDDDDDTVGAADQQQNRLFSTSPLPRALAGVIGSNQDADAEILADGVTFNAAIYAAKVGRRGDIAVELLHGMGEASVHPDTVSFSSAISAIRGKKAWATALSLLSQMKELNVPRNAFTYNAIIKTAAAG